MEAKVGDRVSIDAKKVGQPRRQGVIRSVTKGLSGVRYTVRWDEGHESVISPGAGILTVEGKAKANSGPRRSPSKSAPKKKQSSKKASKRKR